MPSGITLFDIPAHLWHASISVTCLPVPYCMVSNFSKTLSGRYYYYGHIADKELKAQRGYETIEHIHLPKEGKGRCLGLRIET